jgi:hypothetical protein
MRLCRNVHLQTRLWCVRKWTLCGRENAVGVRVREIGLSSEELRAIQTNIALKVPIETNPAMLGPFKNPGPLSTPSLISDSHSACSTGARVWDCQFRPTTGKTIRAALLAEGDAIRISLFAIPTSRPSLFMVAAWLSLLLSALPSQHLAQSLPHRWHEPNR